ncbi:MAG: hypothetical protein KF861_06465 [Planctomycetaceae bacterium]|nr:hypothetical protein [Planctomycetaceae bacterium]
MSCTESLAALAKYLDEPGGLQAGNSLWRPGAERVSTDPGNPGGHVVTA